ncbi:hypothetical protein [Bradyrhizobium sp. CCGE-LA001]|uniref:hypothetical protein n=1 Tax=Bradyrhizobium sp. CCGE-LA001 TaxID=1223566 RepID=UPI001396734D|nr:hypothetical protein [Bradyrhizobium sp. CCGE-LA001]
MQRDHRIFESEELSTLGMIFERTVTVLPVAMRTPENRTAIAQLVLQFGAAGEAELACLLILMRTLSFAN